MKLFNHWIEAQSSGPADRWLLGAVLALSLWGLLMVYSSSSGLGIAVHQGNDLFFLESQLARWVLGVVLLLGLSRLEARYLSGKIAWAIWILAIVVLGVMLLGFGVEVRGARRWVPLGGALIQPSEFARLAMILCVASLLARAHGRLDTWRGMLPPVVVTLVTSGLIAGQPHLSLGLLTAASGLLLIFLAGASLWRLVVIGAACLGAGGAAVMLGLTRGYHTSRVLGFVQGLDGAASYQARQSILGIGSGGLIGMGPGRGLQKHLFLPDPHTDFIMSIIGEELGFIGLLTLLLLTAVIAWRVFLVGRRAESRFGEHLAHGMALQFTLAFLLHAVVCVGWAPTTGVPYPLVSFGGSALIANMIGFGLVLAVSRRGVRAERTAPYVGSVLTQEPWFGRAGE